MPAEEMRQSACLPMKIFDILDLIESVLTTGSTLFMSIFKEGGRDYYLNFARVGGFHLLKRDADINLAFESGSE